MTSLDKFDLDILAIVQCSNRVSSGKIGEQVGLSAPAVQRRLNRMREKGVIIDDVSVVSRERVDRSMTFIVQVSLEREREDLMIEFKSRMRNNPQVQQCYYVTGSPDFILIVTAKNMEGYEKFRRQNLFDSSNIKHLNTNVVMDVVKASLYIPVQAE